MPKDPAPPDPAAPDCQKCGSRRVRPVKITFWPFQEGPTYWRCEECFEIWTIREESKEPT